MMIECSDCKGIGERDWVKGSDWIYYGPMCQTCNDIEQIDDDDIRGTAINRTALGWNNACAVMELVK